MALFAGPTKGLLLVPRLLGNFCEAVLVSWDKEQLQKASTIITTYTPATYVFPQSESEVTGGK